MIKERRESKIEIPRKASEEVKKKEPVAGFQMYK
jgi:hypothetical protein